MHPIFYENNWITISGYWATMAVSLMISAIYFIITNRKRGDDKIPWSHLINLCCITMLSIYLGGALMGVISNIPELMTSGSDYKAVFWGAWNSSRGFYGGVILMMLAFIAYIKYYRLDGQQITALFMPGVAIFMSFGKLGCLMGGCCYGVPVSWGIVFPEGALAPAGIPLFPSQIAEALVGFALLILMLYLKDRLENKYDLILIFGTVYTASRFILDFWRGSNPFGDLWILSINQWISLILLAGILFYLGARRNLYSYIKD